MTDELQPAETALTVIRPAQGLEQFKEDRKKIKQFIKNEMIEGVDYGIIPGTQKKSLWQPGGEKLAKLFGLGSKFTLIKEIEDFEKGFFYYRYRCELTHLASGIFIGDVERSCNSKEKKYSQFAVSERFATEDQRKREIGRFQNNRGYLMIKISKTAEEAANDVNTIQSMAQKRALVACVRTATCASDFFEADISDADPAPTTKAENPSRVSQIKKLHAVARPRGFDEEKLHTAIKKLYAEDSITKLTGDQIADLTEKLEITFEEVGEGNQPKRINGETNGNGIVKPTEEVSDKDLENIDKKIQAEGGQTT